MTYSHYSTVFLFDDTLDTGTASVNILYTYSATHSVPEINEYKLVNCYYINKDSSIQNEYGTNGTASVGNGFENTVYATASLVLNELAKMIDQYSGFTFSNILQSFYTGATNSGGTAGPGHGG
jgi:hypothetical protein